MTEKLLQFIWQYQYFNKTQLQTTTGEEVALIHPGQLNKNQGPDFTNGRIKIGATTFVGSVELHIKASDWQKHRHDDDSNYKNVILHVVYKNDTEKSDLPVLELESRIPKVILQRYDALMNKNTFIACEKALSQVKPITWTAWKERLLAERLSRKAKKVQEFLQLNSFNWEESFWWLLANNFGGKVNGDAFQSIACSVPLTILTRHKASIHQLEALLLGQAGLLKEGQTDSYANMLYKEYQFLSKKYRLLPPKSPVHFLRMRPGNFPTIRLAQLAMLVYKSKNLLQNILDATKVEDVKSWFYVTANDYWHYRYRIDEASPYLPKRMGEDIVNNLVINTVAPFLFCYGAYYGKEVYKIKALTWLEHTRAEKNNITKGFTRLDINNESAFDSQALIELKNQYCDSKRCLDCSIGYSLLRSFD